MLVHYPATWTGEGGKAMRQATWKALEAAVAKKQARAIGVSHYCRQHVEDVLEIAKIKPAINQVEYHVGMGTEGANATDDKVWLQEHGITFQSFSPLCGPCGEVWLLSTLRPLPAPLPSSPSRCRPQGSDHGPPLVPNPYP